MASPLLDRPLLQPNQIQYLGTIQIPSPNGMPAAGIGWGENGTFLAAHGRAGEGYVLQRYNLTSPGTVATPVGPSIRPNLSGFNNQNDLRLYGTLQVNGKVLFAASADYNGDGGVQTAMVASMDTSFGSRTTPQGTTAIPSWANQRGMVGWFALIPQEWRQLLGGYDVFSGTNTKSIVSNDTIGTGFVAFNSVAVNGSGPITTGKYMLFGDGTEPSSLQLWTSNGRYGAGENVNTAGAAIIPGTRTLLYFGHQGTGTQWYGDAQGGRDPCNPYQGDHAYPYEFQAWAFDMRDIVAVRNGQKSPSAPRPYATRPGQNGWNFFGWKLNGPTGNCQRTMYTSAFYDYTTNRIYMGQTDSSLLHVWQVSP